MGSLNLTTMDVVKISVAAALTAIGYNANTNVGSMAQSAEKMQQEMVLLKKQMEAVNGTLIKIVTTQTNMIKTIDDHEGRIRLIEKQN